MICVQNTASAHLRRRGLVRAVLHRGRRRHRAARGSVGRHLSKGQKGAEPSTAPLQERAKKALPERGRCPSQGHAFFLPCSATVSAALLPRHSPAAAGARRRPWSARRGPQRAPRAGAPAAGTGAGVGMQAPPLAAPESRLFQPRLKAAAATEGRIAWTFELFWGGMPEQSGAWCPTPSAGASLYSPRRGWRPARPAGSCAASACTRTPCMAAGGQAAWKAERGSFSPAGGGQRAGGRRQRPSLRRPWQLSASTRLIFRSL